MNTVSFVTGLLMAGTAITIALSAEDAPVSIRGPAHVIDGDTIAIKGTRIRLWGIDSPEASQTCVMPWGTVRCGEDATNALRGLVAGREVACERKDTDRYGRTVAICWVSGWNLNASIVERGYAVDYVRYSWGEFANEERHARNAKLGVWASLPGGFQMPWEYRLEHKGDNR